MALSSFLPTGLVGRAVGSQFGRSTSCGDLTVGSVSSKDGIQMFMSTPTPSRVNLVRMLPNDTITSVNLKFRGPSQGFYTKQNCITSGLSSGDDAVSVLERSPESIRFVLGMSDFLRGSVSTASGKEFAFTSERQSQTEASRRESRILEEELCYECDHGSQLVPAGGASMPCEQALLRSGEAQQGHLHLVADRAKSKVYIRPGSRGSGLELSVHAAPAVSEGNSRTSQLEFSSAGLLADGYALAPEVSLLMDVEGGLAQGFTPELTDEGTGGTYFMSDSEGHKVAVFKPMDEEPLAVNCPRGMVPSSTGEGLKKGTRVGEGAFREVAAYILDHPPVSATPAKAPEAKEGFSGVPLTMLAKCGIDHFSQAPHEDDLVESLSGVPAWKVGSLQQFVSAISNCEDMGPQRFPVHEVHKVAVLDMRLGNTDRNGANILVQQTSNGLKLIPIDHGYCLPETLEELTFEWLYWPQAEAPFDEETKAYIASLDAEEDLSLLRDSGWILSDAATRTLQACTVLLKKGAELGLTPYQIGSLMVREDFTRPSALEEMVEATEAMMDTEGYSREAFSATLGVVIEKELEPANSLA